MARCARNDCRRWRPDFLAASGRSGCHLDTQWFCSSACLETEARERLRLGRRLRGPARPAVPPLKVGVLLVHHGAITPATLKRAVEQQKTTGHRLGAQLVAMGSCATTDVLKALSAQAGASYLSTVDPNSVRHAPGGLSRDAVRALGIVPIEVDSERKVVKVACIAPLPRLSLDALHELTGWTPDPFLVIDEMLPRLIDAYGDGVRQADRVPATRAASIKDAAARVASVAQQQRVRITHTQVDPWVWVRVEGEGGSVEDVILPANDREGTCRVAPTSR